MYTSLCSVVAVLLALQSVAADLPATRTAFLLHQSAGRALREWSGHSRAHSRALLDLPNVEEGKNARSFRTSQAPYMVPLTPGCQFYPIISAGDVAPNGYKMIGIPDGLGAYDNSIIPDKDDNNKADNNKGNDRCDDKDERVKNKDTFTVLMNHEIRSALGAKRAHGATGAFVSEWVIDKRSLGVVSGADLIKTVYLWVGPLVGGGWVANPAYAFDRFCSADLPSQSAIYNRATGNGARDMIFFNGEETEFGKAFAHIATGPLKGSSYVLPRLGLGSWENVVANAYTGDKTVVIATSDGADQRIVVYTGTKNKNGANPVERAGLNNGDLYSILVNDPDRWVLRPGTQITEPAEELPAGYNADFTLRPQPVPGVRTGSGFARPEDGAWDPNNKYDFYFQSTAAIDARTRLWKLRFNEDFMSGKIYMVVQGPATRPSNQNQPDLGPKMLDNLGISSQSGDIVMQEDTGGDVILARLWRASTNANKQSTASLIAQHNPAVFNTSTSQNDEESSGVIPMDRILGKGMWLLDAQAHSLNRTDAANPTPYPAGPEVLEGGQLLAMYLDTDL
eukprot:jgi/Chrzof1/4215/Cz14g03120.t1